MWQIHNQPHVVAFMREQIANIYKAYGNYVPTSAQVEAWRATGYSLFNIRANLHSQFLQTRVDYVTHFYYSYFGRAPSAAEANPWSYNHSIYEMRLGIRNLAISQGARDVYMRQAYMAYMGRQPDANEAAYWMGADTTLSEMRESIGQASQAHRRLQVINWYQSYLNRSPGENEFNYWLTLNLSLHDIRLTIRNSPEAMQIRTRLIGEYFTAYGGRAPNSTELNTYLTSDASLTHMRLNISQATALLRKDFIRQWYQAFFDTVPSDAQITALANQDKPLRQTYDWFLAQPETRDARIRILTSLYPAYLGRSLTSSELDWWLSVTYTYTTDQLRGRINILNVVKR